MATESLLLHLHTLGEKLHHGIVDATVSFGTFSKMRMYPILWAICCMQSVMCTPLFCSAFHQPSSTTSAETSRPRHFGFYSTTGGSLVRSIQSMHGIEVDSFLSGEDNYSGIEVWLDLRGTSLTPNAALELWNLEDTMNNQLNSLDRARNTPFHKCLVSLVRNSDGILPPKDSYENNRSIEILAVSECTDENDIMPCIFHQTDPLATSPTISTCVGRLLPLQASSNTPILPDPLPAMEVVSSGQWIVLDTEGWKKVAEEERLRMVLPLLELLSPGVSGSDHGGIGVTCQTTNEIVKAVMFIQCMTSGGGSNGRNIRTKTLESGIVVPQQQDLNILSSSGARSKRRFAIVVPCDMILLRTAKLMLANNSDFDSVLLHG